jgi:hypothetical protein
MVSKKRLALLQPPLRVDISSDKPRHEEQEYSPQNRPFDRLAFLPQR